MSRTTSKTRPVDQFDRVSLTRQDRYLYAWVRDKKTGKEFTFFIPKSSEDEKRECRTRGAELLEGGKKSCKLQKKAALDFFQEFFKKITEGRTDYELIAQEVLG